MERSLGSGKMRAPMRTLKFKIKVMYSSTLIKIKQREKEPYKFPKNIFKLKLIEFSRITITKKAASEIELKNIVKFNDSTSVSRRQSVSASKSIRVYSIDSEDRASQQRNLR